MSIYKNYSDFEFDKDESSRFKLDNFELDKLAREILDGDELRDSTTQRLIDMQRMFIVSHLQAKHSFVYGPMLKLDYIRYIINLNMKGIMDKSENYFDFLNSKPNQQDYSDRMVSEPAFKVNAKQITEEEPKKKRGRKSIKGY